MLIFPRALRFDVIDRQGIHSMTDFKFILAAGSKYE